MLFDNSTLLIKIKIWDCLMIKMRNLRPWRLSNFPKVTQYIDDRPGFKTRRVGSKPKFLIIILYCLFFNNLFHLHWLALFLALNRQAFSNCIWMKSYMQANEYSLHCHRYTYYYLSTIVCEEAAWVIWNQETHQHLYFCYVHFTTSIPYNLLSTPQKGSLPCS